MRKEWWQMEEERRMAAELDRRQREQQHADEVNPSLCVFVCVCERESEREIVCERETGRERGRESSNTPTRCAPSADHAPETYIPRSERERARAREREREKEREKERARERVRERISLGCGWF